MLSKVLKEVLDKIKPTAEELNNEKKTTRRIIRQLRKAAPKNAKIVLAGSIAKGTFLAGDKDLDLFVLLPKSVEKKEFEGIVTTLVKKAFPSHRYELKYAEHPYARVYLGEKRIDIVPAYQIKNADERMSAVDRSVLHTKFVLKKLKKKQIEDVLLLKKFLKANEMYGAEIKIEGFSGYLCELLIIYYKNFRNAIKEIAKWKEPVIISLDKHKKDGSPDRDFENRWHTHLVVIDPVDPRRNVAAALSKENFLRIVTLARRFLKKPSTNFFLKKAMTLDEKIARMKRSKNAIFEVVIPKPNIVDDILWGQMKKLAKRLVNYLKENEFEVKNQILGEREGKLSIVLQIKKERLSDKKIILGPEKRMQEDLKRFIKAHKKEKIFYRKGRAQVIVKRKNKTAFEAIKRFFRTAVLPSHFRKLKAVHINRR